MKYSIRLAFLSLWVFNPQPPFRCRGLQTRYNCEFHYVSRPRLRGQRWLKIYVASTFEKFQSLRVCNPQPPPYVVGCKPTTTATHPHIFQLKWERTVKHTSPMTDLSKIFINFANYTNSHMKIDIDYIKSLTENHESVDVEFKESTGQLDRGMETLCGMLNGDGGVVVFGVKNNGKIVGQEIGDKTTRMIMHRGGLKYKWDTLPNENLKFEDLDESRIHWAIRQALELGRLKDGAYTRDPIAILESANALAHMDWRKTSSVGIAIYDDRIEIENAGMLPEDIPASQLTYDSHLLDSHTSEPPNEIIARVMYYSGVIEHWGRGLSMIFEECKRIGLPQPTVTDERGIVKVKFIRPNLSGQINEPIYEPINEPINEPIKSLTEVENIVLFIIKKNPGISRKKLVQLIDKSESTVRRALKVLGEMKFVEYRGSNKTSGYFLLLVSDTQGVIRK